MDNNHIYINGLGVAVGDYDNFESLLLDALENRVKPPKRVGDIPKLTNNIALRKMDRLSKMLLLSSIRAKADAKLVDMEKVGTIFNSVFGPLYTNLSLAKYIVEEDLEGVSPIMFANTVNNACVGYACMELGCKGVSTMLLASNYVGYSIHLLKANKATTILTGGADEYTDTVFDTLGKKGFELIEGAAVLALGTEKTASTYSEILGYSEAVIGEHPYYSDVKSIDKERMAHVIKRAITKSNVNHNEITGILSGASAIQETEKEVFDQIFGTKVDRMEALQVDGLGANLGIVLGMASVSLKRLDHSVILVTDLDYSGVYRAFLIKKLSEGREEDFV